MTRGPFATIPMQEDALVERPVQAHESRSRTDKTFRYQGRSRFNGCSSKRRRPMQVRFAVKEGCCARGEVSSLRNTLRELGIRADDLRIIIVHIRSTAEYRAVAAVRYDGHWLILDNRASDIRRDDNAADYQPLVVIDGDSVRRMTTASPAQSAKVNNPMAAASSALFTGPERFAASA